MNAKSIALSTFILGLLAGGGIATALFSFLGTDNASVISRFKGGNTISVNETTSRYYNKTHSFSLDFPKDLAVKEFDEGEGAMTVVFQKPGEQEGFQMFIIPYSGEVISEDRIEQDLKGATIRNLIEIVLPNSLRAVHFNSDSLTIGESVEVWFIKDGYLYEVTTYASHDEWLAQILNTLSFE